MELLIVLGLCFGAYELLGVFQGCFQYNEHPFPYQPNQTFEQSQQQSQQQQKDSDDETNNKQQDSGDESQQENQKQRTTSETEFIEENFDSIKSENCSCYSIGDDVYDDDTKRILKCTKNTRRSDCCSAASAKSTGKLKRKFQFDKTISKFTLSTSLMSLNRDELNVFHYIDDNNNNKNFYRKFDDEKTDIAAIHKANNSNKIYRNLIRNSKSTINLSQNQNNNNSNSSSNNDVNFRENFSRYNEIDSEIHSNGNDVDVINNKKIFFISTTAT